VAAVREQHPRQDGQQAISGQARRERKERQRELAAQVLAKCREGASDWECDGSEQSRTKPRGDRSGSRGRSGGRVERGALARRQDRERADRDGYREDGIDRDKDLPAVLVDGHRSVGTRAVRVRQPGYYENGSVLRDE